MTRTGWAAVSVALSATCLLGLSLGPQLPSGHSPHLTGTDSNRLWTGIDGAKPSRPSRRRMDLLTYGPKDLERVEEMPRMLAAWRPEFPAPSSHPSLQLHVEIPGQETPKSHGRRSAVSQPDTVVREHPVSIHHKTVALFSRYGPWATFGAILVEGMGIPLPGQTLLIGGVLWQTPRGGAWSLIVGAWVAAVVGNTLGYAIGAGFRGRLSRSGPRMSKIAHQIRNRGATFVLLARFVDGARQLNGIAAGLVGLPFGRFTLFNTAGALLWVGVWSGVAWWAAEHADRVGGLLHSHRLWVYAGSVAILGLGAIALRHRHKRGPSKP